MSNLDFQAMRRAMVDSQLRTNAVNDPRVTAAIESVAREAFVPADRRALAYVDRAVPLAGSRALNPPLITARLIVEAGVTAQDNVLVVGAASGYAAAVLAGLAKTVVALESDATLAAEAKAQLKAVANISVVTGDLAKGHAKGAPYDVILVDGAIEQVPEALVRQLADHGRLAAAIIDGGVSRLCVGYKAGSGFGLTPVMDADAVVLPGFEKPKGFTF
ncbi:MAG: protein-L-isoaspartate O-methyltransferase family protein [Chakrabartia sp.]